MPRKKHPGKQILVFTVTQTRSTLDQCRHKLIIYHETRDIRLPKLKFSGWSELLEVYIHGTLKICTHIYSSSTMPVISLFICDPLSENPPPF